MIEAGILDGDTAIIRKAENAENGQIVVALIDDAEATLKVWQKKKDEIWLKPCNPAYEIRKLHPSRVKVQGILSWHRPQISLTFGGGAASFFCQKQLAFLYNHDMMNLYQSLLQGGFYGYQSHQQH